MYNSNSIITFCIHNLYFVFCIHFVYVYCITYLCPNVLPKTSCAVMEKQEFDNCGKVSSVKLKLFWIFESDDVGIFHLSSQVRRRWLCAVWDKKLRDNGFKQLHLHLQILYTNTNIKTNTNTNNKYKYKATLAPKNVQDRNDIKKLQDNGFKQLHLHLQIQIQIQTPIQIVTQIQTQINT